MLHQWKKVWLFPAYAILLIAADPSWKTRPIPNWTRDDARQILTDSPWARNIQAALTRRLNEDELRENSGDMGQPRGIGYDGVGTAQVRPKLNIPTVLNKIYAPPPAESVPLLIRWENALPVRAAELRFGEIAPATLEGDGYRIAVYGIPGPLPKGDPTSLGAPLKLVADLNRGGKRMLSRPAWKYFKERTGWPLFICSRFQRNSAGTTSRSSSMRRSDAL